MLISIRDERGNAVARHLDFIIGVPLVFFLSLFRRKREFGAVKRVALLQTAAIGDTILMSAAIANLRNFKKDMVIDVFCGESNAATVGLISGVDDVVVIPVKNPFRSIKTIREKGPYDIWIDFGPWPRINALYSFFSRSSFTVGFDTKGQFRHYLYDMSVVHSDKSHEIDNQLSLIKFLVRDPVKKTTLNIPQKKRDEKLVVLHPFPGGSRPYLKKWDDAYWNRLAQHLLDNGYKISITGGPGDRAEAEKIFSDFASDKRVEILAGGQSFEDTARILKAAQLVVSVNTGTMHLASALGSNLVVIQGPTSAERWGPLNENSFVIQSGLECSPCLDLGFDYGCNENRCMRDIPVERVIEACGKFLM